MFRRLVATLGVLALAVALALIAWPQLLTLQRAPVLALAVSFRGAAGAVALAAAVVLTAIGLVMHRLRRGLGVVALLLVAFAASEVGVLVVRGVGAPDVPVAEQNDVTVLSWNTLGDSVPAQVIARVAEENRATVVTLPETTETRAHQVADLLADAGVGRYAVFAVSQQAGIPSRSTSVLVSTALGTYKKVTDLGDTVGVPSVVLDPAKGQNAPRIVAVHTTAPYQPDPKDWRHDLAWVAARCSERNVLIAGDFNATIDHLDGLGTGAGQLRTCRDAGLATRNAAVGTWPTSMPALIGTPIDHVLATPNWRFTGFRVLSDDDSAGSDHRPVLARLRPAG